MKYIRFDYSAGYCGTDTYEFGKFDDEATDEEINDIANQICEKWCDMYGFDKEDEERELDYSWKEVSESEVEMNNCFSYTNWV